MSRRRLPAAPRPSLHLTSSRRLTRLLSHAVALVVASHPLFSSPAHASDWINITGGGTFSTPANWSAGVPGPGQIANFNLATTSVVTFTANATNASLSLGAGSIFFAAAAGPALTYTLTGNTALTGASLALTTPQAGALPLTMNAGALAISNSVLSVNGGNKLSATALNVGHIGPGTGNLIIDNGTFNTSAATTTGQNGGVANIFFQNNALGAFADFSMTSSAVSTSGSHLFVQSGSAVTASGNMTIGPGTVAGQSSTILVDGTASTFTQTGATALTLGAAANSTASLTLTNGGAFTTGTATSTINPTGAIVITNGNFNAIGDLTLDHGSLTYSAGTFNLATGKTLTAQNAATLNFTPSFNLPGGRTFIIQSGAHFTASDYFDLNDNGSPGTATLIVDGTGSSFTAANRPWIGAGGGSGVLTIRNDATAAINSGLDIGANAEAGTSGIVNVQSGGKLTVAGDITVAPAGGGATGLIHLTDGILVQTTGLLILGASTGTSAVLTIDKAAGTGGTFTSSTSGIGINKSGTLNLVAGALSATGNIYIDGGAFNYTGGSFDLVAGKDFTATNSATVTFSRYFGVKAGATFTINTGSHLSITTNFLDVGNDPGAGLATLIVDGTGSSFTASTEPFWGYHGGKALVTIRNNATASLAGGVSLAEGTNTGTAGTLSLQSGAQLVVGNNFRVATGDGPAIGFIHITDATLSQSAGTLTLGSATGTGTATLTIDNATGSGGTFTSSTGGVTVNKNAAITITKGTLNANGNLTFAAGAALSLGGLTNAWTGRLELGANPLLFEALPQNKPATLSTFQNQIAYGTTHPNGITSATTAADPTHKTTVAIDNALLHLTTFLGTPVNDNTLLVLSTWYGDSNLDRQVNVTDLGVLATYYGQPVPNGILQGDFNNDGLVNVTDLGLLATNYGQGTAPGSTFSLDSDLSAFTIPSSPFPITIPEPATLIFLASSALLLKPRTSRRR